MKKIIGSKMDLSIEDCAKCPALVACRQNIVNGEGPVPCDIMYLARNPGKTEDKYGRPLIGTAGHTAMEILGWVGLTREQVYLTNVVKCWTPGDRTPYSKEIEACRPYLVAEICAVRPKVIVATGREAVAWFAPYLTDNYKHMLAAVLGPISDVRGIPFAVEINSFRTIVVPTYHPSFVSRMRHITTKNAKKKIFNAKPVAVADAKLALEVVKNGWIYQTVDSRTFVQRINVEGTTRPVAFDTETTGLNPLSDKILGFAVSDDGITASSSVDTTQLAELLESSTPLITQNGPFDYRFTRRAGIKEKNIVFDTMFAGHALAPDLPVNLGFLNSLHLHMPPWKTKTKGAMNDTEHMDQEELHKRCCEDAASTHRLAAILRDDLKKAGLYESPFKRLYMPLIPIMVEMMLTGMKFSQSRCDRYITYLFPQYKALQDKWIKLGCDIASNKQVGEFLVKNGVPLEKRTKTQWAVDDSVLETFHEHALVADVRLYRKLQKLLTTDLSGMRKRADEDGIIRSNLDVTGTGTGRFSSTDPDLLNIRLAMRNLFVARDGHYLYGLDYKSMELYAAALLAGEHELVKELLNGRDVHEEMRQNIYGSAIKDPVRKKSERRVAKSFVFGPLYGKNKYSIARDLHITQTDADRYLAVSCTQRPKFVEWRNLQADLAYGSGAVFSAFGRRRLLFADNSTTQAYNSPVQMTAHDIVLETMILIHRELGLTPWVQVYDSLVYEIPGDPRHPDVALENEINEIATRPITELAGHRFQIDSGRGHDWKQIDVGMEDVEE